MNLGEAWRRLKIARTEDAGAIRRAYAAQLKQLDLDRDAPDYAALRAAREVALRWASGRQQVRTEPLGDELPVPPVVDGPAVGQAAWPYAAPLAPAGNPDPALTVALSAARTDPYLVLGPSLAQQGEVREVPLPVGDPFAVPPLPAPPDAGAPLIQPDRGRDVAFYNALFPDGEVSEDALAGAELAAAQGHSRALLRQAQEGNLALSEATDNWLADTLARAWPRSAPFVAEAAEAFGWREQAGLLGERPAVAFLNARLKGMRFHERVLEPGHILHKAWVELSQSGPASALHRLRIRRDDVEKLILGVRKNFPELEHFWDPQRVASWEGAANGSGNGPGVWIWILIAFGVIRLLASLPGGNDREAVAAPPSAYLDESKAPSRELLEETVKSVFGAGIGTDALERLNPELAQTFRANLPSASWEGASFTAPDQRMSRNEEYLVKMRNLVRDRVHRAAREAGDPDLGKAMELRLAYLVAARRLGPEACMEIYRLAEVPAGVSLDASVIVREQALAARFLRDGLLAPPGPQKSSQASVPGPMVEKVLRETALSPAQLTKAMQGEGSDANRCAVSIALIRAALKSSGPERQPILRTL